MGGRGSSMRGSQGMGGGAGAPAAAAQVMPAVQAAPVVQAVPQQAGPPTGANGFGHLTPQQVSAMESAAKQAQTSYTTAISPPTEPRLLP